MNEPSQRVRRNNAQEPKNEENDKNRPKHRSPPREFSATDSSRQHPLTPRRRRGLFPFARGKKKVCAQPANAIPHPSAANKRPRTGILSWDFHPSKSVRAAEAPRREERASDHRVCECARFACRVGGQRAADHSDLVDLWIWIRRVPCGAGMGLLRGRRHQPHSGHHCHSVAAQSDLMFRVDERDLPTRRNRIQVLFIGERRAQRACASARKRRPCKLRRGPPSPVLHRIRPAPAAKASSPGNGSGRELCRPRHGG